METANQKVKLLVYGSLKEGQYNFDRIKSACGEDSLVKIEDRQLQGFDMYDLGAYPAIVENEEGGTIECQLLEASPRAAGFIQAMELGAGYEEKLVDGARIYTYRRPVNGRKKVTSGNWK